MEFYFKTEPCRSFSETGRCRYGNRCQYAHGDFELRHHRRKFREVTDLCLDFHTLGFCKYGVRCTFKHSQLRYSVLCYSSPLHYLVLHAHENKWLDFPPWCSSMNQFILMTEHMDCTNATLLARAAMYGL